ncbi:MAG: ankyrin repeat domain-containing protein [Kineosporiaceae bacterium]
MDTNHGWGTVGWDAWTDAGRVREHLAAGADPDHIDDEPWARPLHLAAETGSGEAVTELAAQVSDIDALDDARSALWVAVYERRTEVIKALLAAGADPWRPMMAGWSPGRLALAGPDAALFTTATGISATAGTSAAETDARALSQAEAEMVARSARFSDALTDLDTDGLGLAAVAGIDAREAIRRLRAVPDDEFPTNTDATGQGLDPRQVREDLLDLAVDDGSGMELLVGVSDVPGGCVITQPWSYAPSMPVVQQLLSAGTRCYGFYGNPKSGDQGSACVDGARIAGDTWPGGPAEAEDPADLVLISFLHNSDPVGYVCAYAGLHLDDARPVTGLPDHWVRLPERDYWTEI